MFDLVFTVAVRFASFDEIKLGQPEAGLQFVAVLAGTEPEAHCIAAQMVACHDVKPTRTTTLEVPA